MLKSLYPTSCMQMSIEAHPSIHDMERTHTRKIMIIPTISQHGFDHSFVGTVGQVVSQLWFWHLVSGIERAGRKVTAYVILQQEKK